MPVLVFAILNQLLLLISLADMALPLDEPGRVQVRELYHGKTVVGSQGELFRGASVAVFKFRREIIGEPGQPPIDYATDPAFWDQMQAADINAVRVVFFDPWQRSHGDPKVDPFRPFPYACLSLDDAFLQGATSRIEAIAMVQNDRQAILDDFDAIVDLASREHQVT